MSCLGIHFSIDQRTVDILIGFEDEASRVDYVKEEIEPQYFDLHTDWMVESGKAWDAIHRALTDGRLTFNNGSYPLNHVILGGDILYNKSDYILSLKTPRQVKDISQALHQINIDTFRKSYFKINPVEYGCPVNDQDFKYTWSNYEEMVPFWYRAAAEGRYVLFTTDQ